MPHRKWQWLAAMIIVLILAGVVSWFVASRATLEYWALRLRSDDPEIVREYKAKLLALGPNSYDRILHLYQASGNVQQRGHLGDILLRWRTDLILEHVRAGDYWEALLGYQHYEDLVKSMQDARKRPAMLAGVSGGGIQQGNLKELNISWPYALFRKTLEEEERFDFGYRVLTSLEITYTNRLMLVRFIDELYGMKFLPSVEKMGEKKDDPDFWNEIIDRAAQWCAHRAR